LSIVVPYYNVAAYVADCLESIAAQTFRNFEVILVDDGSTDTTAEIVDRFCGSDGRFQVVRQQNEGLGPARNTGARHAVGEFITFVDSDDLVPHRAYEMMVESLDRTGSSFVAGDARRFNSFAVRDSWVHRVPFATDREATHVIEFEQLAIDRTVWNKVYRRSFWDEFGYSFPSIRYEDYPVTLAAHLDAVTVDVLAAPVYYWREREGGESITQRVHEYDNLVDRVASAEMVISLADQRAPFLNPMVHRHFARVDLVALLQAFRVVPSAQERLLLDLGRRLIARLDATEIGKGSNFDRLQVHALQDGDIAFLRRLAEFRHDGLLEIARGRRSRLRRWRYEHPYPGATGQPRKASRRAYRVPSRHQSLRTSVSDVFWRGPDLHVRGTAEIRHLRTTPESRLRLALNIDGDTMPCDVRRFNAVDSHGEENFVGFELRLDPSILAGLPAVACPIDLDVDLAVGRFRRRGKLTGLGSGSPTYGTGRWVSEGSWMQPRGGADDRLVLEIREDPCVLTNATFSGDDLLLEGSVSATLLTPSIQLLRHSTGESVVLSTEIEHTATSRRFRAKVPPNLVVDRDAPDDPVSLVTSWQLTVADKVGEPHLVTMTGPSRTVSRVFGSRILRVTRTASNHVELQESPSRVIADIAMASTDDGTLRVAGELWTADIGTSFVWRQFVPHSNHFVDAPCCKRTDGARWIAEVPLDDLRPREQHVASTAKPSDWVLLAKSGDRLGTGVTVDPFLACGLPLVVEFGRHAASIESPETALRVHVR
jgi:CDP-glycerol glycerophosphotransferase